ncbi:hypothetical protein ABZT04_04605 [Streptomyces sp. NPDC005492]|uniref:hypothetical protein n=1 Tax=Streptomyces sp. NPDC005492 TaxID=3156883 RepID=UPI0033B9794A
MERRQERSPLRHRTRYLFDRTLARSTGALLGWLALRCLAVVVPVSTLLVWADPNAPHSRAPLRMLLSVLLGPIALLCVPTVVGVVSTGLGDRQVITVLADRDPAAMERALTTTLGVTDGVRLECRTGVPSDPDTLRLVSLGAARAVVVLPAEGPDVLRA